MKLRRRSKRSCRQGKSIYIFPVPSLRDSGSIAVYSTDIASLRDWIHSSVRSGRSVEYVCKHQKSCWDGTASPSPLSVRGEKSKCFCPGGVGKSPCASLREPSKTLAQKQERCLAPGGHMNVESRGFNGHLAKPRYRALGKAIVGTLSPSASVRCSGATVLCQTKPHEVRPSGARLIFRFLGESSRKATLACLLTGRLGIRRSTAAPLQR